MRHVRAALARIAGLFTGDRADEDLRDELRSHVVRASRIDPAITMRA